MTDSPCERSLCNAYRPANPAPTTTASRVTIGTVGGICPPAGGASRSPDARVCPSRISGAHDCDLPSRADNDLMSLADVELDGQRHRVDWPRQSTLVDVLLDAGIDVPHSCREGHCGSCVCTVVS